jgi:hypothetical protein
MKSVRPGVLALVFAARFTSPGWAEARTLDVELNQCANLNAEEISHLLELELSSAERESDTLAMPPVRLVCQPSQIRVTVDDPVTQKTLSREIAAPSPNDPTGNRIVALAVAELFLSSWLELLLPPERRVVKSKAPTQTVARLTRVAKNSIEPKPIQWELGLDATLRLRHPKTPFLGYRPALLAAFIIRERYRLLLSASLEYSRVSRTGGDVAARTASLGTGAGVRLNLGERFCWDTDLLLSLVSVSANGESTTDGILEHSASGFGFDTAIKSGPMLRLGTLFTKLELQSGLTTPRFTARVPGDTPVQLGGWWLGLGVELGISEGEP